MADPGDPAPLPPPALFLDQNEARRAEKKNLRPGPLPFMSGSGYPPPPLPLYGGLDPPLPMTKFLDVNERIYMILSFVPGEGLKVIQSGFSGAACEQQTYFRSSLLSLRPEIRLLFAGYYSFRTLIFTALKIGLTQIYSVQIWCKKVFSFWRTL